MSKMTHRETATRDGRTTEDRLARLLETSSLAQVVPRLAPEMLHQLIRHRGLEACGEIVTSATPAQLTALLDLDLWRPAHPTRDDQFDVARFGEWLEVLADTEPSAAARTIASLDQDVVIVGLSRYVRVFDPGTFEPTVQSDDEPAHVDGPPREHPGVDGLEGQVGGYIVRARRADAWDAIVTLLVALEAEHGKVFHAVMQGCRRLSNSSPEIDGLDDLLQAPTQHLHDVAVERERRRSLQGYATPADARAFLQMARQPRHTRSAAAVIGSLEANPIVAAYFRAADDRPESPSENAETESIAADTELLTEAGGMPKRPRALLEAADGGAQATGVTRVRQLMEYVRDTNETAYLMRGRELAFVANALLAGCSVQSREFTPEEASDAAACICNLGLEYWPARWPGVTSQAASAPPDSFLIDHDLVTAFEVGWSVLHQDVSLFVAQQLISIIKNIHCADLDLRRGFAALRRTLVRELGAGTPWLARDAADVLAMCDATAWISVLGLLGECPVLPAALAAVLDGRTTRVSPSEFDFISTPAQIGDVRMFVRKLPGLLTPAPEAPADDAVRRAGTSSRRSKNSLRGRRHVPGRSPSR